VTRELQYQWHLAELMTRAGMLNSTDIGPLLHDRGINYSPSQLYRLYSGKPERISLPLLVALCDILGCNMEELITYDVAPVARRRAAGDAHPAELRGGIRPKRAEIFREK